jgi:hypothetical protein
VHLRDGDREIEVSGNPAFVRQVLDDLPSLLARLRGEAPGRTTISMPAPPAAATPIPAVELPTPAGKPPQTGQNGEAGGLGALESQVFDVLRTSSRPLAISAIRERMESEATGQQVRRLLERAGDRVTVSADRPATYSLR